MWQEDLRVIIETHFQSNWDFVNYPFIDYGDNSDFKPPTTDQQWLRISFKIITNDNAEIGTRFNRAYGILTAQCFSPLNQGQRDSNLITGKFGEIFQNKNIEGLHIFTMTPLIIGETGNWFQVNAKLEFYYDFFI